MSQRGWNGYRKFPGAAWHAFSGRLSINAKTLWFSYLVEIIWPPQIKEFPNCVAHQLFKGPPETQVQEPLYLALLANQASSSCSNQEGAHRLQRKKKERCSRISHQFKHYSSNSALPIPCPLAGDLPSTNWCTGLACGHLLWKKDWRWKLGGERPQQRPTATNCPANHPCFYRLSVLKSSACEFG